MSTLKKPDLSDPKLRAKLAKGMGHNYYGEPAWPNDLLYILYCIVSIMKRQATKVTNTKRKLTDLHLQDIYYQ